MANMSVMDGAALWGARKTPVTISDGQGEESLFLLLLSMPYGFTAAKCIYCKSLQKLFNAYLNRFRACWFCLLTQRRHRFHPSVQEGPHSQRWCHQPAIPKGTGGATPLSPAAPGSGSTPSAISTLTRNPSEIKTKSSNKELLLNNIFKYLK